MKNLFHRNLEACVTLFTWFEGLILFNLLIAALTILVFHLLFVVHLLVFFLFVFVFGLLAYQIGYHPIVAVLWCVGLFIPFVNFIVLLLMLAQSKTFLRKNNYKIGLWSAHPIAPESPTIAS